MKPLYRGKAMHSLAGLASMPMKEDIKVVRNIATSVLEMVTVHKTVGIMAETLV